MTVDLLVPKGERISLDQLAARIEEMPASRAPFSDSRVEFCAEFSRAIFDDSEASRFPDLIALAFWMRKAALVRLRDEFRSLEQGEAVMVPRGTVFHLPPGNVDTIFVYSWLLSMLTGNRNVLRLSPERAPQAEILLDLLRERPPEATLIVSYGHEAEPTAAISARSDVRVIWGGDESVSRIRQVPLPPHARELTFPDRSSMALFDAAAYVALDRPARARLAARFFNDAFWFDQMACSSPRMVVWRGSRGEAESAAAAFWRELAEATGEKSYDPGPAATMAKFVQACRAIVDLPACGYARRGEATIVELSEIQPLPTEHCGAGFFLQARVDAIGELAPALGRRDQTLAHFGFSAVELRELAASLGGRAIDRMVPVGQALQFHRLWDGCDLLQEFCRRVHIVV